MTIGPGRYRLGPEHGRLLLRTYRDGFGARAGHDLVIEVTRWSAELTVTGESTPAGLDVRADLHSLAVREGSGGVKPLTDRDRREIAVTARKVLDAGRHPEAAYTAASIEPDGQGWMIDGGFTLAGRTRPLRLRAAPAGPGRYRVSGSVVQSEYGIKPYTAFMGALRVRDAVDFEVSVTLTGPGGSGGT
jgi:polyisoprenoid-binding protein YceI